ncbi:MAG TPA: hypothetical protein ENI81_04130 [Phycisphaerales bacterium]|nr:hypothetical protein [Phycisphaerales bacterium]
MAEKEPKFAEAFQKARNAIVGTKLALLLLEDVVETLRWYEKYIDGVPPKYISGISESLQLAYQCISDALKATEAMKEETHDEQKTDD